MINPKTHLMRFVNFTIINKRLVEFRKKVLALAGIFTATGTMALAQPTAGNALSLDGTDDYVSIGAPIAAGSSYTKEAWIMITKSFSSAQNIISSDDSPFWISSGKLQAGNNGSSFEIIDPVNMPGNTWVHVAVTFDAATRELKLYRNGVVVASATSTRQHAGQGNYIGAWSYGGPSSYLGGKIDNVRIWNTVRTADEIKNGMYGNVPANSAGLLAYYTMNEAGGTEIVNNSTSADAPANSNGTLVNGATWTASPVQHSQGALLFNGTNSYVKVPPNTNYDFVTGTIECMVQPRTGLTGNGTLIGIRDDATGTRVSFHMSTTAFAMWNGSTYSTVPFVSTPGTWYNLAFVCMPAATDVYVDGDKIGAFPVGVSSLTGLPVYIGYSSSGEPFTGAIDEVRIWNTARTETEIEDNMNKSITAPQTGLVALFNFDQGLPEGSNAGVTTAIDGTSYNNHGTLTNFALTGSSSNWIEHTMNLSTLPVNFLSFTARIANEKVLLNWSTTGEQNNKHFEVERSTDGASFYKIGTVSAASGGSATHHYQFTDASPARGILYYRLKQVDIDGHATYSDIRQVQIAIEGFNYSIAQNPVTSELRLNIGLDKAASLHLEIRDASGSLLLKKKQWFNAGTTAFSLPVGNLAKGMYIINIVTGKSNHAKTFVKQ
jgi:hypothetical protein